MNGSRSTYKSIKDYIKKYAYTAVAPIIAVTVISRRQKEISGAVLKRRSNLICGICTESVYGP